MSMVTEREIHGAECLWASLDLIRKWRESEVQRLEMRNIFTIKLKEIKMIEDLNRQRDIMGDFVFQFLYSDILEKSGAQLTISKKFPIESHYHLEKGCFELSIKEQKAGKIKAGKIKAEDLFLEIIYMKQSAHILSFELKGNWIKNLNQGKNDVFQNPKSFCDGLLKKLDIYISFPTRFLHALYPQYSSDAGIYYGVQWEFSKYWTSASQSGNGKELKFNFTTQKFIIFMYKNSIL
jgi:hypothetical protein